MKPSLLKSLDMIPAWEIGLPALVPMRSDSNTTFRKMERLSITLWKRKELSIYHLEHTNIWKKVREFLYRLLNSNSISLQSLYWRSTTWLILKLRGGREGSTVEWSAPRPKWFAYCKRDFLRMLCPIYLIINFSGVPTNQLQQLHSKHTSTTEAFACEQALQLWWAKRADREPVSEWQHKGTGAYMC